MKISVKVKVSSMDEIGKAVEKLGEIEKVRPNMYVDIEVDCRKRLFDFSRKRRSNYALDI